MGSASCISSHKVPNSAVTSLKAIYCGGVLFTGQDRIKIINIYCLKINPFCLDFCMIVVFRYLLFFPYLSSQCCSSLFLSQDLVFASTYEGGQIPYSLHKQCILFSFSFLESCGLINTINGPLHASLFPVLTLNLL